MAKNNWFFNKNLIDEIKEFTNDEIEQEQLELEDQVKENEHLKEQLNLTIQRQEDYLSDNRRLSKELEELKEAHKKILQSKKIQETTYKERIEQQEQRNIQLTEVITSYEEKQKDFGQFKDSCEKNKVELLKANEIIEKQEKEISTLNERFEQLNLERTEPQKAYEQLNEYCEKQKSTLLDYETQLKKAKKQHFESVQRYTSIIQQVNRLEEERGELRGQLKQHVIKNKQLEERLVNMEGNIKEHNKDKQQLEEQLSEEKEELTEALHQAQERITLMEAELADRKEYADLDEKNKELSIDLTKKENEILQLKEQIEVMLEGQTITDNVSLVNELNEKVEELENNYEAIQFEKAELFRRLKTTEEVIQQKNQQLKQFEELLVKQSEEVSFSPDELAQAKKQIEELTKENDQLKVESTKIQLEIGEVLFSAKKQANRTIEEAQSEAKHLIDEAELEVETIGNRARKILLEVSESKDTVIDIYTDLEQKVEQLAKGALLNNKQN